MLKERVKKRMKDVDMLASELSRQTNITKAQLSLWFNDKQGLNTESLERICKVLNLELKPIDNELQ